MDVHLKLFKLYSFISYKERWDLNILKDEKSVQPVPVSDNHHSIFFFFF